ncbi:MAG: carbohydrate ABC transporter permease [Lachnospiraceae bacterium]|nr:carbohydrate ABC transporter permease [Lachnospiraceae bacterium]
MNDFEREQIESIKAEAQAQEYEGKREVGEVVEDRFGAHASKLITDSIAVIVLTALAVSFMIPIAAVIMNSFKKKSALPAGKGKAFDLINKDTYNGFQNYKDGMKAVGMSSAIKNSFLITIIAVLVLVFLTSMTAWYLVRVKTVLTSIVYYGFVFSMIVPFQMVMCSMSLLSYDLGLATIQGLVLLYVGFGAGMCVFMFSGFVKSIPLEIEEAAMIDGCNPIQTYFRVVFPMLKPIIVTVSILETMWVWNDYLLPKLTLPTDIKTIPIAIEACTASHGVTEIGWLMAMLVIAIIPIVIFYLACQKHIIRGVAAGAVKG